MYHCLCLPLIQNELYVKLPVINSSVVVSTKQPPCLSTSKIFALPPNETIRQFFWSLHALASDNHWPIFYLYGLNLFQEFHINGIVKHMTFSDWHFSLGMFLRFSCVTASINTLFHLYCNLIPLYIHTISLWAFAFPPSATMGNPADNRYLRGFPWAPVCSSLGVCEGKELLEPMIILFNFFGTCS